ncbi:FtsW/RodA/SpoVE family cell cycle protein [Dermacoccus nishinomiyaensis]|uniref:FtsW/RodA/SpoVE family cell cycle protein n=1 Tax=Dermacoccus nishinomiyaensis TaxID=1274 RepID=UPI0011A32E2F|nr:FtsW/RodA/SpoVE family cell cycle protein [Dermacoccus nishinomiyaensis]
MSPDLATITGRGTKRGTELMLLAFAVGIVLFAYANVGLAVEGSLPTDILTLGVGMGVIALVFHLVVRVVAAYADPVLLPAATLLNGLGLVMIRRIDMARGKGVMEGAAVRQLMWSAIAVAAAIGLLCLIRDHRRLRRYTFTFALAGLALLMMPLLPFIGMNINGNRIWIHVGPLSFQPSEVAKILLTIFFASYLVQTRDALSLVGKRVFGFPLPRARDMGPILLAWLTSLAVLVFEKDLGTSLLFFGLFVAMLYVATERRSWIAIGLGLFFSGCYLAYLLFPNFQNRVTLWLDPFAPGLSDQVARSLMGLAFGGLTGTGLGRGYPTFNYAEANSDFIMSSFGEELGLVGLTAMIALFAIIVERGLRIAIACRDGFGKLLATGLAFSICLQCFVVLGGITRVIPLTGLTTPFLSAGGSSLLANWAIIALLLRISDQARRPAVTEAKPTLGSDDTQVVKIR